MNKYKTYPLYVQIMINLMITAIVAALIFFIGQALTQSSIKQQNKKIARQAATTANQFFDEIDQKSQLIAQDPSNKNNQKHVKLINPINQSLGNNTPFFVRALISRAQTQTIDPYAVKVKNEYLVYMVNKDNNNNMVLTEWSLSPLLKQYRDLSQNNQLKLQQNFDNSILDVMSVNWDDSPTFPYKQFLKNSSWSVTIDQNAAIYPSTIAAIVVLLLGVLASLFQYYRFYRAQRTATTNIAVNEPQVNNADISPDDINHLIALDELPSLVTDNSATSDGDKPTPEPQATTVFETPFDDLNTALRNHTLSKPSAPVKSKTLPFETVEPLLEVDTQLDVSEFEPIVSKTIEFNLPDFDLKSLAVLDPLNNESGVPESIFRAYDIRGATDLLTPEVIQACGRALASKILANAAMTEVVVGYDARETSEEYARLMSEALIESGLRVIELGRVPTPVMYFAAKKHQGNGIMITASHSATNFNGIKWLINNTPPAPEDVHDIYERAFYKEFVSGEGLSITHSYTKEYIKSITSDIAMIKPLKIVIDGMNGTMGNIAKQVFEDLNCEVIPWHCEPDGSFPRGAPDPSKPHMLEEAAKAVVLNQADIGVVFDGDGDRLVVIDNFGQVVAPDQLIAQFATIILESEPGSDIVYDVKCSRLVPSTITENGGRPVMIRTGSTFLRRAILEPNSNITLAAEFAGHIVINDSRGSYGDDGLYAALRLIEWFSWLNLSVHEVFEHYPQQAGTSEINIPIEYEAIEPLLDSIKLQLSENAFGVVNTTDGIRVDTLNGFGLIRRSNTGPYLNARFDATSVTHLNDMIEHFARLTESESQRIAQLLRNEKQIEL